MSFDRNLAVKAGVRAKHIQRLVGVSRYTANNWLSGRREPHDLLQKRVARFMQALTDAVAAGDLPIADDGTLLPEERSVALMHILRERMEKLDD